MADIPKEIKNQGDEYAAKFKNLTQAYVKKCIDLHKGPAPKAAHPYAGTWPFYPWWNIFLVGPIQLLGAPPVGPFKPSKIIAHGNPAYMFTFVWRNPAGISWDPNNPSACQSMAGREFQINFEVVNLTSLQEGPDLDPIKDTFPVAPDCLQAFFTEIENFPQPQEGKPHLYNLYATIDVVDWAQPMAGFATWVLDLDTEPTWLWFPEVPPQWQYDHQAQFMVYYR